MNQDEQPLKTNPNDVTALRQLPYLYSKARRWADAVEAEKRTANFFRSKPDSDPAKSATLRDVLEALAWYQLFARDFSGSLASSQEGRKLDPANLSTESEYAYALMLLGRNQQAEAIYIGNIGRKMPGNGDQLWESAVLGDFDLLEKEGITSPEIPRLRTLLQRPGYERQLAQYTQKLKTNPNDEDALRQLPNVYFHLDQKKEAVDAGRGYVEFLQRQTNHDANWSSALSGAYIALAYHQLFIRDFSGALESSDDALKLNPKDLVAETNRAHALLFLGRVPDAETVYLQYRGRNISPDSDQKWEEAILNDFDDLESAGITHPYFANLRGLLHSKSK
jgi:tetratricopeptide (TPR) repeat protein